MMTLRGGGWESTVAQIGDSGFCLPKPAQFLFQKQAKFIDLQLKTLKARNEYLLCIDAANAALHKYFADDLSNLADVSTFALKFCGRFPIGFCFSAWTSAQNNGFLRSSRSFSKLIDKCKIAVFNKAIRLRHGWPISTPARTNVGSWKLITPLSHCQGNSTFDLSMATVRIVISSLRILLWKKNCGNGTLSWNGAFAS